MLESIKYNISKDKKFTKIWGKRKTKPETKVNTSIEQTRENKIKPLKDK